nr:unnamed protein product [Callosobruchus chinensis]
MDTTTRPHSQRTMRNSSSPYRAYFPDTQLSPS